MKIRRRSVAIASLATLGGAVLAPACHTSSPTSGAGGAIGSTSSSSGAGGGSGGATVGTGGAGGSGLGGAPGSGGATASSTTGTASTSGVASSSGTTFPGGGPSCAGGTNCNGESCCAALPVPGGSFPMGRSLSGTDACPAGAVCDSSELPEHTVTISAYTLDKYEVTVGRFRSFVAAFDGWSKPSEGDGANPNIPGSGWQSAWSTLLDPAASNLRASLASCSGSSQGAGSRTWTDTPSDHENAPITCVDWYEGFAFCIWDGGRLPTEAEWEFAAAGGGANRLYPWGGAMPTPSLAVFATPANAPWIPVGSTPAGAGLFGHMDLGGGAYEWIFDVMDPNWYTGGGATCTDCANVNGATGERANRGGGWLDPFYLLRAAGRGHTDPTYGYNDQGLRCAR